MRAPLIRPGGGLIKRGGGLIRPGGGLLRVTSSGIPHTLDGIANASDPLQAFADACGMSFKMDYIWIGNPATGDIIELGGSGIDLVPSAVTLAQADPRLGDGNTVLFDSNADVASVTNTALDIGTGPVAQVTVVALDAQPISGLSINGKRSSATGYRLWVGSGGQLSFEVKTSASTVSALVNLDHGTAGAVVALGRRLTSENKVTLHTGAGGAEAAEASVVTADAAAAYSVGLNAGVVSSFRGSWGLSAFVKGANAELVTPTHRANLQAWLGF